MPTAKKAIPLKAIALIAGVLLAIALALPARTALADTGDENLVDPAQRADNSFIYDTTIESLSTQASLYDGQTVQVIGEVIGDRIDAGNGIAWITLTVLDVEDKTTISVLMSDEQANQVDHFGRYGITGTVLQVRGTYNQACSEHEGQCDIHATDSSVVTHGVEHADEFVPDEFAPGLAAIIVGFILMVVFYFISERMR